MKHAVICGGGAAGFFTAIQLAEQRPDYTITILEKSGKLLTKVLISGGGRCNVTNGRKTPGELTPFYPRGSKKLHKAFKQFGTTEMVNWLKKHGVATKTEPDLRVFPASNKSQTIAGLFTQLANQYGIQVITNEGLKSFTSPAPNQFNLTTTKGRTLHCNALVLATGSSKSIWKILEQQNIPCTPPVPSLFTFNNKDERIQGLMGLSFPDVHIKVAGTKLAESGPCLITHWGISGPAVLKLSAHGARFMAEQHYTFPILINFFGHSDPAKTRQALDELRANHQKKQVRNSKPEQIPERFWTALLNYCEIRNEKWSELPKKPYNRLVEQLSQGSYQISGKGQFKEEFVTCGGVALSEIDLASFSSRQHPGLYLCGEILDIDALTGGFNFQACWTGGYLAARHIAQQ